MRTQLLATFTTKTDLEKTIESIKGAYTIAFSKIYVLQNEDIVDELICTYNVDLAKGADFNDVKGTISLHRKKHTNTLYTINALNEVIRSKNNGVLDKRFMVDWNEFRNTLLLTNDSGLHKIHTRIYSIIDVKTWNIDKNN